MRTSGTEMELAQRTLHRVEELTSSLPVSIHYKTLFVAGETSAPWASVAVTHATIRFGVLAASFDVQEDVESAAQGLSDLIFARWGDSISAGRRSDVS